MEEEKILKFMQTKKAIYFLVAFVVICILLFILVAAKMIRQNQECVSNPFTYAANRIIVTANYPIQDPLCSCDMGMAGTFYFDKDGIYKGNPRLTFNWSE